MLDERTLVLEGVTLAQVVKLVVQVLVDLASSAVLDEQAAEDTQTAHPHHLAVYLISIHSSSSLQRSIHGDPALFLSPTRLNHSHNLNGRSGWPLQLQQTISGARSCH